LLQAVHTIVFTVTQRDGLYQKEIAILFVTDCRNVINYVVFHPPTAHSFCPNFPQKSQLMQHIIRRISPKEQPEFTGPLFFRKGYWTKHILKTVLSGRGFSKGFREDREVEMR
jgi:hypothetical protein